MSPPTHRSLLIAAPPLTINAPVLLLYPVELLVPLTVILVAVKMVPLKVIPALNAVCPGAV